MPSWLFPLDVKEAFLKAVNVSSKVMGLQSKGGEVSWMGIEEMV